MNASNDDPHAKERQSLQTRLLNAVKQCQVRFGGKTELATELDSRVSCLCAAWEAVLQHGLKSNSKALTALRQVTELPGLNKMTGIFTDLKNIETEPVFWTYVKEHLTRHEAERFYNLKNISTDSGRGRAWLRASLNEHSLERYMHMIIEREDLLGQHYENWSFLMDQEKSSMLPMMARGLDSILFAVTVDKADLNTAKQHVPHVINAGSANSGQGKQEDELRPVIAGEGSHASVESAPGKKKDKKKKKKAAIVSFGDDDAEGLTQISFRVRTTSNRSAQGSFSEHSNSPLFGSLSQGLSELDGENKDVENEEIRQVATDSSIVRPDSRLSIEPRHEPSITSGRSGGSLEQHTSSGSVGSADFDISDISGSMLPMSADGDPFEGGMRPVSNSDNIFTASVEVDDMEEYRNDDIQTAAFALKQAQKGFQNSHRTEGDGGNEQMKDTNLMSTEDLKKAVVAMMVRKDEIEEQNRSLKLMLEQEMETSSTLRAEIEEMKHSFTLKLEKEAVKLQALQKENQLLKHQLRKYVNAVQMLRTDGSQVLDGNLGIHVDEPQPNIPPVKPLTDYSHEAEQYEKKLIQVAEMHGELMEFNELLHRQMNAKEVLLKKLQQELIDLRGPLPTDLAFAENYLVTNADSLNLHGRTLINIWIPSAFLQGSRSDAHHVYQVYIRIRDEEWNVYRRYKQFDELHKKMKKDYPFTSTFEFPPKKKIGKKDARVVEHRRQILQNYLRCLINHILQKNSSLAEHTHKDKLLAILPFFSDKSAEKLKKSKKNSDVNRIPLSSSPQQLAGASASPNQYDGL
ncbi:hypothetical protein ACJMK2_034096 [Sinanodonta woodiana]|uniref:Sorting nexin-29 n=1 Tax=Sinanodonta woodiana TaxID=1069815 RepID=A0ABD3WRY4_SINWO